MPDNKELQIDPELVKLALGDWQLQVIMMTQYIKTLEDKIESLNSEMEITKNG